MEPEYDKERCSHCRKEIAVHNLQMHELHCRKYRVECPTCGEFVSKNGLQDHEEEEHKEVSCDLCARWVAKNELEEHKEKNCTHKPTLCSYCHLQYPSFQFDEHEQECGSRTDDCDECSEKVMLKYMLKHQDSGCLLYTTAQQQPRFQPSKTVFSPRLNLKPTRQSVAKPTSVVTGDSDVGSRVQYSSRGLQPLQPSRQVVVKTNRTEAGTRYNGGRDTGRNGTSSRDTGSYATGSHDSRNRNTGNHSQSSRADQPLKPSGLPAAKLPNSDIGRRDAGSRPGRLPQEVLPKVNNAEANRREYGAGRYRLLVGETERPSRMSPHAFMTPASVLRPEGGLSLSPDIKETIGDQPCLPCEFCDIQMPMDMLMPHQVVCAEARRSMYDPHRHMGPGRGTEDHSSFYPEPLARHHQKGYSSDENHSPPDHAREHSNYSSGELASHSDWAPRSRHRVSHHDEDSTGQSSRSSAAFEKGEADTGLNSRCQRVSVESESRQRGNEPNSVPFRHYGGNEENRRASPRGRASLTDTQPRGQRDGSHCRDETAFTSRERPPLTDPHSRGERDDSHYRDETEFTLRERPPLTDPHSRGERDGSHYRDETEFTSRERPPLTDPNPRGQRDGSHYIDETAFTSRERLPLMDPHSRGERDDSHYRDETEFTSRERPPLADPHSRGQRDGSHYGDETEFTSKYSPEAHGFAGSSSRHRQDVFESDSPQTQFRREPPFYQRSAPSDFGTEEHAMPSHYGRHRSDHHGTLGTEEEDMDVTENFPDAVTEEYAECEYCTFPVSLGDLELHHLTCFKRPLETGDLSHSPPSSNTRYRYRGHEREDSSPEHLPSGSFQSRSLTRDRDTEQSSPEPAAPDYSSYSPPPPAADDNVEISCEFCDTPFPEEILTQHQYVCKKNTRWSITPYPEMNQLQDFLPATHSPSPPGSPREGRSPGFSGGLPSYGRLSSTSNGGQDYGLSSRNHRSSPTAERFESMSAGDEDADQPDSYRYSRRYSSRDSKNSAATGRGGSGDTAKGRGGSGDTAKGRGGSGDTAKGRGGSGDTAKGRGGSGDTAKGHGVMSGMVKTSMKSDTYKVPNVKYSAAKTPTVKYGAHKKLNVVKAPSSTAGTASTRSSAKRTPPGGDAISHMAPRSYLEQGNSVYRQENLPCEFCREKFSADRIFEHQNACTKNTRWRALPHSTSGSSHLGYSPLTSTTNSVLRQSSQSQNLRDAARNRGLEGTTVGRRSQIKKK